ncbi:ssDNA endodeoxyribonuclease [Ascosphaera aggregata]|nr:ssDNA endodeoxyribonuclease [Ascosphaera aggregata]
MPVEGPLFSAISTSTQHLYLLLRCIGFNPKALVHITPDGIRFLVEDGRVMQGLALLDKSLFERYIFNAKAMNGLAGRDGTQDDATQTAVTDCRFLISLSAFLETLQILGLSDTNHSQPSKLDPTTSAFSGAAVMLNKSCTISYMQPGSPLCTTLVESGVTTTCELTTYELDDRNEEENFEIPLQRDAIIFKTIMRSTWLHNAVTELAATDPAILSFSASSTHAPYLTLSGSGGPFSDSTVEFSVQDYNEMNGKLGASHDGRRQRNIKSIAPMVAETFQVRPPEGRTRVRQRYKFALVRKAIGAMAASSKVSIRCDSQGVLSLQFMIELGNSTNGRVDTAPVSTKMSSAVSFVDFKFVPIIDDSDGEETQSEGE